MADFEIEGSSELEGYIGAVEARLANLNAAIEEVGNVQMDVSENTVNGPVRTSKAFRNTNKGSNPIAALQQAQQQTRAELNNLKGSLQAYLAKQKAKRATTALSSTIADASAKGPRLMLKETYAVTANAAVAAKEIKPTGDNPINILEFRATGGGMKVETLRIGQMDVFTTTTGFLEVPTGQRIRIAVKDVVVNGSTPITFGVSGGQSGNLSIDAWLDPDPIGAVRILA